MEFLKSTIEFIRWHWDRAMAGLLLGIAVALTTLLIASMDGSAIQRANVALFIIVVTLALFAEPMRVPEMEGGAGGGPKGCFIVVLLCAVASTALTVMVAIAALAAFLMSSKSPLWVILPTVF